MGEVINLKERVLDYKPGATSEALRYHALEIYSYFERLECGAIKPNKISNNITFCDFALIKIKNE